MKCTPLQDRDVLCGAAGGYVAYGALNAAAAMAKISALKPGSSSVTGASSLSVFPAFSKPERGIHHEDPCMPLTSLHKQMPGHYR